MKVIKSGDVNWQDKNGYSKKVLFEKVEKGVIVQEVKIGPGETAKSHYHKKQTEVFYFQSENGFWFINGKKFEFNAGDILIIEPQDKHEVTNNTSSDYVYIAFKYNYEADDLYWD